MPSRSDLASALAVTLLTTACGGKSVDAEPYDAATADAGETCATPDRDGDGFDRVACGGADCEDDDDRINPAAIDAAPRNRWTFVRLASTGKTGLVELAMDRDGVAHVAFTKGRLSQEPEGLTIGEIGVGTIVWMPIDFAGGLIYPFAIAAGDNDVEVLYASANDVFFATRSDSWRPALVTILDEDVGRLSIRHDSEGTTHVFYQEWAYPDPPEAIHAVRLADGSWNVVENVAGTAVAFSPEGERIVVAHGSAGDLYVDRFESEHWSSELVDDVDDTGHDPAVAIGATGEIWVSYLDLTRGDLKVATDADGGWAVQTIDENGRVGDESSIAIDPSGQPVVAYSEGEGSVRFARRGANGWSFGRLPSPVRADSWPRLAFAPTGAAIIAFSAEERPWVALMGRDGVDQNCDGIDAVDADFDGHTAVATGGDDCFDGDADVWQCDP